VPDIVSTFSDPIRIPCRIVRRGKPQSAASGPFTSGEGAGRPPGPSAPIREPGGTAPTSPLAEQEATSPELTGAARTTLPASIAALSMGVVGVIPDPRVKLAVGVAAGAVVAAMEMLEYLAAMTGDRNAGQPPPM
jgi:A nuclease family of the HNH/ENDO VII superfamily with conserved AHH